MTKRTGSLWRGYAPVSRSSMRSAREADPKAAARTRSGGSNLTVALVTASSTPVRGTMTGRSVIPSREASCGVDSLVVMVWKAAGMSATASASCSVEMVGGDSSTHLCSALAEHWARLQDVSFFDEERRERTLVVRGDDAGPSGRDRRCGYR